MSLRATRRGVSVLQTASQSGQRGWKWQPLGGVRGLGMAPSRTCRSCVDSGSGPGTALSRAVVEGGPGLLCAVSSLALSGVMPWRRQRSGGFVRAGTQLLPTAGPAQRLAPEKQLFMAGVISPFQVVNIH